MTKNALGFGRNSSITEEKLIDYILAIEDGYTFKAAAEQIEMGETTVYRWKRAGRALLNQEESSDVPRKPTQGENESDEHYATRYDRWYQECVLLIRFYLEPAQAFNAYENKFVKNLEAIAETLDPKAWQVNAWMLERRNPKEYGQTKKIEQEVNIRSEDTASIVSGFQRMMHLISDGLEESRKQHSMIIESEATLVDETVIEVDEIVEAEE